MYRYFILLLCLPCAFASASPLVSANALQASNPDAPYLESSLTVDINHDGVADRLDYVYSSQTPPAACSDAECEARNEEQLSRPSLTFSLLVNGTPIAVDYICESLELLDQGPGKMADIRCGDDTVLTWSGSAYVEKPRRG